MASGGDIDQAGPGLLDADVGKGGKGAQQVGKGLDDHVPVGLRVHHAGGFEGARVVEGPSPAGHHVAQALARQAKLQGILLVAPRGHEVAHPAQRIGAEMEVGLVAMGHRVAAVLAPPQRKVVGPDRAFEHGRCRCGPHHVVLDAKLGKGDVVIAAEER